MVFKASASLNHHSNLWESLYTAKGLKSCTDLLRAPSAHTNPLLHQGYKDLNALAEKLDSHHLFQPIQARRGFKVQEVFICTPTPPQNIKHLWNKGT